MRFAADFVDTLSQFYENTFFALLLHPHLISQPSSLEDVGCQERGIFFSSDYHLAYLGILGIALAGQTDDVGSCRIDRA